MDANKKISSRKQIRSLIGLIVGSIIFAAAVAAGLVWYYNPPGQLSAKQEALSSDMTK